MVAAARLHGGLDSQFARALFIRGPRHQHQVMDSGSAPRVVSLGELLVEVMRKCVDADSNLPGEFAGPFPSGAPAIFAAAVARLGVPSGCIGVVGADDFGECVLDRLRSDGVDTSLVRVAQDHPTGIAFVSYQPDGGRRFVFTLGTSAAALLAPDDVPPECARTAEVVHVTGSSLAVRASSAAACTKAAWGCPGAGGRVSFDPTLRPELLGGLNLPRVVEPLKELCSVLLPSAAEAS